MHKPLNKALLLVFGIFVLFIGVTDSSRLFSPFSNLASLTTGAAYGERLGQTVDDVVNTIHATVPGSLITHADVLTIMCMEQGGANPNLRSSITSGAGAKGLTQVMPGTFSDYKKTGRGGFNHLNCSYSQIQTNPRCAIEAGSRIFNDLLMRYNGNRTTAARAYNGGPGRAHSSTLPAETRKYAYQKLPECWNAILAGKSPVASSVWSAMIQKVASITGGSFKLAGLAKLVPFSASGWADIASNPQDRLRQITSGWFNNSGLGNNPIASFLGVPQQTQQTQKTIDGIPKTPPGYLDPATNPALRPENDSSQRQISGTTNSAKPGTAQSSPGLTSGQGTSSLLGGSGSDDLTTSATGGAPSPTPIAKQDIEEEPPTLLCLPTPINPGEEALILWACRDGAYKTVGENFNTNEALIGKTRVNPTQTTTYTLECINNTPKVDNTASSCTIQVANPQLALIATPRTTTRGRTVSLSWKTTDITSCTLTSNAHPTFTRNGTEGDVTSPSLIQNTTFTLTCETTTGSIKEKSVVVGVR